MKTYIYKLKNLQNRRFVDILVCLLLFNPLYVNHIVILNYVFDSFRFILIFYLLYNFIKNYKVKGIFIPLILIFGSILISTLINDDNTKSVIIRFVPIFSVFVLVEINKKRLMDFCYSIFCAGEILVYINFLSMLLYPNGIYIGNNNALYWIIGQKQDFVNVFFIIFLIGFLLWKYNVFNYRIIFVNLIMLYCMIKSLPVGLLIVFFILLFMVTINKKYNILFKSLSLYKINLSLMVIAIIIAIIPDNFTNLLKLLDYLPSTGMSKYQTIYNRILIWNDAINIFSESPLLGSGIISPIRYNLLNTNFSYHPHFHNIYFDLLATGGILSVVAYIVMNVKISQKLDLCSNSYDKAVLVIGLFALNILLLTECLYSPFVFIIYTLCFNVEHIIFNHKIYNSSGCV